MNPTSEMGELKEETPKDNTCQQHRQLPRQFSANAVLMSHRNSFGSRHRPRRCLTETDIGQIPLPQHSFKEDVQHAAAETYLITSLSFTLLSYLGLGYRWITKLMQLGLYALFLMPGFLQVGWYYYFSGCVHRSIVYGDQPRNRLDLYLPGDLSKPRPAVAFVTGGAWIIGYKAWGALLAKQLVERNVIVACIDYRNFPQGTISDMVEDVSTGISFFCNNIASLGGDPTRLYLAGQSAGAHLASCALVNQASREAKNDKSKITWSASCFKMFFAISGGYNLLELVDHFHLRGLYKSIFLSVMEGEESLSRFSPEIIVKKEEFKRGIHLLPPFLLFHGMADYSIPYTSTVRFADALQAAGVEVTTKLFPHKTHTDLFLQDPMRGGRDELFESIVSAIYDGDEVAPISTSPRMVPELLLQLARIVSPF